MSIPGSTNPLLLFGDPTGGQYQISRSLRFNSSDSAFCSRTPAVAGNRTTWTWAGWMKPGVLGANDFTLFSRFTGSGGNYYTTMRFNQHILRIEQSSGAGYDWYVRTTRVFRDSSAWYHIVVAINTNLADADSRVKLYINGVEESAANFTRSNPARYSDTWINTTSSHSIGEIAGGGYFEGYLADIHFIDGQALDATAFTEVSATTGQLIPKAYSGSFGTNGFWLKFSDNSAATAAALGNDYSGNNNDWTPNNLSVTAGAGNDSLVDTPTSYGTDTGVGGEVRGNYCTWNPLAKNSAITLANGNLDTSNSGGASDGFGLATIAASTGKFYWEVTVNTASAGRPIVGAVPTAAGLVEVGSGNANSVGYRNTGVKRINGSDTSYGNSYTNGDVIGVALDLDNGAIYFSKNGTFQNSGSPTSGSSKTGAAHTWTGGSVEMTPGIGEYSSNCSTNWGSRPFAYTAPSGFKALCDTNLGAPLVAKPNTVMDVVLYTGTGAALTPTSSLGFNPDWIWIKSRSAATDHALYDVVRGAQARLESNNADAEVTTDGGVTAFNSAGFTLGTLAQVNTSSATYVAWCWDAGTSTVSNTAGSIASQVRANVSAGFSVVTYTGTGANATVGHGLGVTPSLLLVKNRDVAYNWRVWHNKLSATEVLYLNDTSAVVTGETTIWNSTLPTSTVFNIGTDASINGSTQKIVCYAFAPVVGYSSMGSYVGNGSADGPFVYTGFRPRWLMIKVSSAVDSWMIKDSARGTYNPNDPNLYADLSSAEQTSNSSRYTDFVSNGFKLRGTDNGVNGSGNTYIYYAVAENPFQYARAR